MSQALGISRLLNASSLMLPDFHIQDQGIKILSKDIVSDTRIGVDYAGEDAKRPWRFYLGNSDYVSRKQ